MFYMPYKISTQIYKNTILKIIKEYNELFLKNLYIDSYQ